jgi:hypothetical protein
MKLPYLESLSGQLDTSIYNRGLKLYLEGGVSNPKPLLLDNWRTYNVTEKYLTYEVRIPVLHLALEQSKYPQAWNALQEVVSCECELFMEGLACTHIVAVLAHMDKEFNFRPTPTRKQADPSELFDTIFTAQKVKTHRKWLATMDTLLTRETANYYYLDEISKTIKEEVGEHDEFFEQLKKLIEPFIGFYTKEKRVVRIALEAILIGKSEMYKFFIPYISRIDEENQFQFWTSMWKLYWMGACEGYKDSFIVTIRSLSLPQKAEIFRRLSNEYAQQREVFIEFCYVAQYYEYLITHKHELSETELIRLTVLVPDLREETDILLAGHIRTWSDFLQVGEYKEFKAMISLWADKLGKSELFVETCKYVIISHQRKKSLVNFLKAMI